jgi:hypothetical protein
VCGFRPHDSDFGHVERGPKRIRYFYGAQNSDLVHKHYRRAEKALIIINLGTVAYIVIYVIRNVLRDIEVNLDGV